MEKYEIIELTTKLFFRTPIKERRFYNEARIKIRRKEAREHLEQFHLACELTKLIRHCFPELLSLLKQVPDPRHQSYITYPGVILLMTRILSSLFYINSMRKASEEFNSEKMIKNIRCFATSKQIYQVKTLSFSALPEFFYVKFYVFLRCIILRFT